jgi:hypothetical protein
MTLQWKIELNLSLRIDNEGAQQITQAATRDAGDASRSGLAPHTQNLFEILPHERGWRMIKCVRAAVSGADFGLHWSPKPRVAQR